MSDSVPLLEPLLKLILHETASKPHRIAVLGHCHGALLERLKRECTCIVFTTVDECAAAPFTERQADMALLNMPASCSSIDTTLGLACRLFPGRLLVHAGENDLQLPAQRYFALGFRRLSLNDIDKGNAGFSDTLYEYRLSNYKQPPEWLNARFWANPERFSIDSDEAIVGAADSAGDPDDWIDADDDDEEQM
ncbi:MAG: DUF6231 family protein [Granulosicoccus sp.]